MTGERMEVGGMIHDTGVPLCNAKRGDLLVLAGDWGSFHTNAKGRMEEKLQELGITIMLVPAGTVVAGLVRPEAAAQEQNEHRREH